MLKFLTPLLLLTGLSRDLAAQKPAIDSSIYGKWPAIDGCSICNNGNYACYTIKNQPVGGYTAVIQATQTKWHIELPNVSSSQITQDNQKFIFRRHDSLGIGVLGDSSIQYLPGIKSFKLFNKDKNENWLTYRRSGSPNELIIKHLQSGLEKRYLDVDEYWFDKNGHILVLQINVADNNVPRQQLKWVDLQNNKDARIIWEGKVTGRPVMNDEGTLLAFTGIKTNELQLNGIWYYQDSADKAKPLADNNSPGIENGYSIVDVKSVNSNNYRIFFTIKKSEETKKASTSLVDVWSYKDAKLQSQQLAELNYKFEYLATIDILSRHILIIENKDNRIKSEASLFSGRSDYALMFNAEDGGIGNEWNWNKHGKSSLYLLSLKDGSKHVISKDLEETQEPHLLCLMTPCGKYVLYYDPIKSDYFSYSISSGEVRNLTTSFSAKWTTFDRDDEPKAAYFPLGVAGFADNDGAVLIKEQHDLYLIDLTGKTSAFNLTNGYGRQHNIVFRLALSRSNAIIKPGQTLILSAFNRNNKNDGFYSIKVGLKKDPTLLSMQSKIIEGPEESKYVKVIEPMKARDCEMYIVRKMNASESPNYFTTSDFRTFSSLSNIYPEKKYNWLTTELVTWKTLDGRQSQGVLYKPENFNPQAKYPLIIYYYEKISETLHAYIEPKVSNGPIEIPLFVSNGYLVFTPDIHYKLGWPGKSAYNVVVSAATYLTQRSYVNARQIGLQGHSFGGFQTNYIITHSRLFAAAASASGMSDFVSIYGSIVHGGTSRQRQYEIDRDRMGATLWNIPNLYIENSPVLMADKVTTPLLMMANREDDDVPYQQGVEFFTGLRRLGKKAWMLQYDGQGHSVYNDAALDFTIRMFQFFNFYLKDSAPPKWMTEGIPAKLKGIETGLELDRSGKMP